MKRRGFTIVEMAVVIALITILSLVGVAALRSSQVAARDDERRAKAESIARALEGFYKKGDTSRSIPPGRYPTIMEMQDAEAGGYLHEWFPELDINTFRYSWDPNQTSNLRYLGSALAPGHNTTENDTQINTFTNGGQIVYEPLGVYVGTRTGIDNDAWASCFIITANIPTCSRFNIYFKNESDGVITTIRSENQQ